MSTPLAHWMKANGKTDAWLAEQVGRDRSVVTRIKNGKGQPSLEVAVAIAAATNGQVRVHDFISAQPVVSEGAAA